MSNPLERLGEGTKYVIDTASLATVAGALLQILPQVAAALSILWTVLRVTEDPRVVSAYRWLKAKVVSLLEVLK